MQFMDATARRRGVPGGREGDYFFGFAVAGFAATLAVLWTLEFFAGAAVVAATAGAATTLSAIAEAITRFISMFLRGRTARN